MESKEKLPLVVALMGSPGSGKSTLASYVFARLKMLEVNCELVNEFAKDKVWEENNVALDNQIYVFAKQYYRIARCAGKVDVIVTDSPLALTPFYNKEEPAIAKPLNELALTLYKKYPTLTYFLKRVKKYNPVGRLQTEEQSNEIAAKILDVLDRYGIDYTKIDGDLLSADKIVDDVMRILNKEKESDIIKS